VACALDAATGHMLWSTQLFAAHSSLPAIANGVNATSFGMLVRGDIDAIISLAYQPICNS
jgi:hypothetical protein